MGAAKPGWLSADKAIRKAYQVTRYRCRLLALLGRAVFRGGLPQLLLSFRSGIGDQLLCTAVLREFRRRGRRGLWVISDHPELFLHNDDVDFVVPPAKSAAATWLKRETSPVYTRYLQAEDRDIIPTRHIIAIMCRLSGLDGTVALRPYLTLRDQERQAGRLAPQQIAIQSSGLGARYPMRNKEWYPERFQAVVDALRSQYTFVQLGAAGDPPLEGAVDLRGTTTLRQTAAVLSQSLVFVGQVGFLMHLARAVDCRAAIVYGGREHPSQSGYSCNENLFSSVHCAPCWKWNTCEYDRKCMRMIGAEAVVAAVERQVARAGQPLPVDEDTLP
jgi:hypothetical protein